ncbi:MAG: hypothetical protein R3F19_15210 [Verrucomicrobiales bacterium]
MLIIVLRWLLVPASAAWGVWSLRGTLSSSAPFDGHTALAVGYACLALIAAAVLIAPDFVRLISRPLFVLIESLYLPSEKAEKPPLTFRLGRYYAANGRLQDAEKDYLRMLRFYPEETDGWIELITLYWTWKPAKRKRDAVHACERGVREVNDSAKRLAIEKAMSTLKAGELPVNFVALAERDKAQKSAG